MKKIIVSFGAVHSSDGKEGGSDGKEGTRDDHRCDKLFPYLPGEFMI